MGAGRQAAEDGGDGEDRQRQTEDRPGTEAIGNPAAGGDKHGEGDQVGADADVQVNGFYAKSFRHIRKGGGNHRAIQELHKECTGHKQRSRGYPAARLGLERLTHCCFTLSK